MAILLADAVETNHADGRGLAGGGGEVGRDLGDAARGGKGGVGAGRVGGQGV
jgi:hypothetical protein